MRFVVWLISVGLKQLFVIFCEVGLIDLDIVIVA